VDIDWPVGYMGEREGEKTTFTHFPDGTAHITAWAGGGKEGGGRKEGVFHDLHRHRKTTRKKERVVGPVRFAERLAQLTVEEEKKKSRGGLPTFRRLLDHRGGGGKGG